MSVGPKEPAEPPLIRFLEAEPEPAPAETPSREPSRVCTQCGEPWPKGESACPLCEVRVVGIRDAPQGLSRTFGIGTLMIIIAAIAITIAVMRELPVVGVVLGIHLALTLMRTLGGIARAQAVDWPLTLRDKLALGGESLGVAFLILGGSGMTFALTMIPLGMGCVLLGGPAAVTVAALPALGAAAYVAHRLRILLWPVRFHH